jgi:hypothetical protein
MRFRAKRDVVTAVKCHQTQVVELSNGRTIAAAEGDYIVDLVGWGRTVLSPATFVALYEPADGEAVTDPNFTQDVMRHLAHAGPRQTVDATLCEWVERCQEMDDGTDGG